MSCEEWGRVDAAYVLGALAPTERRDFEHHLDGCASCATSVRELAGLPGLLGRLGPDEVTLLDGPGEPPPPSLLPTLLAEATRRGRVRRTRVLGAVAAAVVLVVAGVLVAVQGPGQAPPTAGAPFEAMAQVQQDLVRAKVSLTSVPWGTRVRLRCAYDGTPASVASLPPYTLVVRTGDGTVEQVATWRAVAGEVTIDGATAARAEDIASVEVRTADGRRLLDLDR